MTKMAATPLYGKTPFKFSSIAQLVERPLS